MLGEMAALGSAAAWAVSSTLVKNTRGRLGALPISAMRSVTGAVASTVVVSAAGQVHHIAQIPGYSLGFLLGSAVATMAGDVLFVRAILADNISRVFPIVTSLYILFSVLASAIFADQPITLATAFGGVFVLAGVYLTVGRAPSQAQASQSSGFRPSWQGLGFSTAAALAWTVSLMGIHQGVKEANPLAATALRNTFMSLGLVAAASVTGGLRRRSLSRPDLYGIGLSGVLWGLSSMMFLSAVKLSPPGTVAILSSTSPLFLVPIAYFVLHERITLRIGGGTAICVLGVILTV